MWVGRRARGWLGFLGHEEFLRRKEDKVVGGGGGK